MYQYYYAAFTCVHVLLAPVTTFAHGVEKVLPVTIVKSTPVKLTNESAITVSVPVAKLEDSPVTLTITPVPTSTVSVPVANDEDKLPRVTKASASATAEPKAAVIVTDVGFTCVKISITGVPIAKSN